MIITSGLRNKESYEALVSQGYPASKTSDHFGWSEINPKGTGAADFYCSSQSSMLCGGASSMKNVFDWVIRHLYDKCRQIIYYPDMNVVHVSNNFNSIFMMEDNISSDRRVMIKRDDSGFIPYSIN
jgi:hypothetical protein